MDEFVSLLDLKHDGHIHIAVSGRRLDPIIYERLHPTKRQDLPSSELSDLASRAHKSCAKQRVNFQFERSCDCKATRRAQYYDTYFSFRTGHR